MKELMISPGKRLEACAGFVRRGSVAADIGTDHAYLPVWLIQQGICPKVYASDINEEPIRLARKNIEFYGISDKVEAFTSDGLQAIPKEMVTDFIIAGMGGDNIVTILNEAPWLKNETYRLILQPMSHTERLREYLFSNGFDIIAEKAVCEAVRLYTVICAAFTGSGVIYDDFDLYAGKLDHSDPVAAALLGKQAGILRSMAAGYQAKGAPEQAMKYAKLAERIQSIIQNQKPCEEENGWQE